MTAEEVIRLADRALTANTMYRVAQWNHCIEQRKADKAIMRRNAAMYADEQTQMEWIEARDAYEAAKKELTDGQ